MGVNHSKRGSYDFEKSAKKAASKNFETEKAISFINLTEQEVYEDLFPFRRRSTRIKRNVHDEDPRPYSIAVMEDNYDDPDSSTKRTSYEGKPIRTLERRNIKSEPILYNEVQVEDIDLRLIPNGTIINQNEGYVYSVEDFPQQYHFQLRKDEPISTFIRDSPSNEERQYCSIQENSKRTSNETLFQPRRASCPEISLGTENSYFPKITEYYFQTIPRGHINGNQNDQRKVSGSSSTSSGMSEVRNAMDNTYFPNTNPTQEQKFIPSVSDNASLTKFDVVIKEEDIDPCSIYDTIKTSDVLRPYEIELINDWLSKAQAECYTNRERRPTSSNNYISFSSQNEEDFLTAASDSLPSYIGSKPNKVTFDKMVTKRIYTESSESDDDDRINRKAALRRHSDTTSSTSSGVESVKYSYGQKFKEEKSTICSEDGYKSSEENTDDSEEDEVKMRERQIKLLMSNTIISAESIEQLRNSYHARMSEADDAKGSDLNVISETEEEDGDEENFYDALDHERNKELIEFIEQYPSFSASIDGNYLDGVDVYNKDKDLDAKVQNSFAEFETLCQTEELRFDTKFDWDGNDPIDDVDRKYPVIVTDLDKSFMDETVENNDVLELGRQGEHTPNNVEQTEGLEFSETQDGYDQHIETHFPNVEKLELVHQTENEIDVISETYGKMQPAQYYDSKEIAEKNKSKTDFSKKENINLDASIMEENVQRQEKEEEEEDLYSNYEYINSLMKKTKKIEDPQEENNDILKEDTDNLISVDEDIKNSGQVLHFKQVKVQETYKPDIFENDDIVYPVPNEKSAQHLEELIPYTSDNFDFGQSIRYEFIQSQQLIYPVKIKDEYINTTTNTKYEVTSYDPDMRIDNLEIIKPFDEKLVGLLPNEIDLKSEDLGIIATSSDDQDKTLEQYKSQDSIVQITDEEILQELDKELSTEDVLIPELQDANKFPYFAPTNPFISSLTSADQQVGPVERSLVDDAEKLPVVAPKPKPRKNPPKSKKSEKGNSEEFRKLSQNNFDDIEPKLAVARSTQHMPTPTASKWILENDNPNDDGEYESEFSIILNKDLRDHLHPRIDKERNSWFTNQDRCLEKTEDVAFSPGIESNHKPNIPHTQEKLIIAGILPREELNKNVPQSESPLKSFDMNSYVKPNVLQENHSNEESPVEESNSVEHEENLTVLDYKQEEIDLEGIRYVYLRDDNDDYRVEAKVEGFLTKDPLATEEISNVDTKPKENDNQWHIKANASDDDDTIRHNLEDILEIQSENSLVDLDGQSNSIFLDYLRNDVITDRLVKNEYLNSCNNDNESENVDNIELHPKKEFERFSDQPDIYFGKQPLKTFCKIQKLPIMKNIYTSVVYYEHFEYPNITEKKGEDINLEKEDSENHNDNFKTISVVEEVESDIPQSSIYPVHILNYPDETSSPSDLHFLQTIIENETTTNYLDAATDSEIFPVHVTMDPPENSESQCEQYDGKDNKVEDEENESEHPADSRQTTEDNFNELNKLPFKKEAISNSESNFRLEEVATEEGYATKIPTKTEIDDGIEPDVLGSSRTLDYLSPDESLENLKDDGQPFALKNNYTFTQPIAHSTFSENSPIEETESRNFDKSISKIHSESNRKAKDESLSNQNIFSENEENSNGDRKQDILKGTNKHRYGVVPRKTLSQIFRNRQYHYRSKSVTDLTEKMEVNLHRTKSNPEETFKPPSNSNNDHVLETYLQNLFSKISNTKAINTLENLESSTDVKVNQKFQSTPKLEGTIPAINNDDCNFTNPKKEQLVLNVDHEANERSSDKKNAVNFGSYRENPRVKEESEEELQVEKILQDLELISERIKSSDDLENYIKTDDLYKELLKLRVAVHRIRNRSFNDNLKAMRTEALKKIRSLLKDLESTTVR